MMCSKCTTVVVVSLLVASVALANTGTGDPRCPADFDPMQRCPSSMILPGGAGLDPSRNIDPTSCVDQENCPKCLDSPEWQTKLKDLVGLYSAKRDPTFKPWISVSDWISHEITSTIAMILLRETMDIDARAAATDIFGNIEHICCSEPLVSFESWDSDVFLPDDNSTASKPVGYTGQSGFFVPPYTIERYPLAFTYQSYLLVEEYKHIFDRSFTTACENMTQDETLGCVDGNYACQDNEWTNTTCYDGKWYVPPQCNIPGEVGNPNTTNCQEVYLDEPFWEPGLLEGMIKNNGLNMTAVYLGGDNRLYKFIEDSVARKKDIMFYWWRPDPLISRVDARQVQFDDATPECTDQYNSDPTLNTAKCGFPLLNLQKRTQATTLAMDADFKHFFDTFSISDTLLNTLIKQHTDGGGNSTVYDISCNWIKGNIDTWSEYVKNTPTIDDAGAVASSLISNPGVLATVIVIPIIVVIIVAVFVTYLCLRHRASTRNAPITAPLAIVFTDIESSTMLWEAFGDEMGRAVEIHHAIIRNHIDEYGAYEVKTVGDSFMIACGSLADATLLCLAIQTSLGECTEFPEGLRFQRKLLLQRKVSAMKVGSSVSDGSRSVSQDKGHGSNSQPITGPLTSMLRYPLRVRIALHWCHDVTARMDRIHGRYDYYGHDVNVCARVEGQAQGCQIMVTADTMKAITQTDVYGLMIAPDTTAAVYLRNVPLKGVTDPVTLYVLAPTSQITSGYIPTRLIPDSPGDARRASSFLTIRVTSLPSAAGDTMNNNNISTNTKDGDDDGGDDDRCITSLFRRVDSSQQHLHHHSKGGGGGLQDDCLSDQYTLTRTTSGEGPLMTCSSPRIHHHHLNNHNPSYSQQSTTTTTTSALDGMSKAALLRVAFKAIPDAGKMAWMTTVAQDLSITLHIPDDSTDRSSGNQTRSAQRVELFKIFEQIQIAVGGAGSGAGGGNNNHNNSPGKSSEHALLPQTVMVQPNFSDVGSSSPLEEEE